MGKGARNRTIRQTAVVLAKDAPKEYGVRTFARALRKGRLPFTKGRGQR